MGLFAIHYKRFPLLRVVYRAFLLRRALQIDFLQKSPIAYSQLAMSGTTPRAKYPQI